MAVVQSVILFRLECWISDSGFTYIQYARLYRANLKIYSFNSFPPKVSRYFCTPLIPNDKFEITSVPQIAL